MMITCELAMISKKISLTCVQAACTQAQLRINLYAISPTFVHEDSPYAANLSSTSACIILKEIKELMYCYVQTI